MRIFGLFLAICGFVLSGPIFAEAQTRAGRGAAVETGGAHLDNACRVRINDLRVSIQNLTNDINEIRDCSARGGVPMRSAGSIICRDIVLGHHELQGSGKEVRFASDKGSSGWGSLGDMMGVKGDPGRDVRCDQCTGSWVDLTPRLHALQTLPALIKPPKCVITAYAAVRAQRLIFAATAVHRVLNAMTGRLNMRVAPQQGKIL